MRRYAGVVFVVALVLSIAAIQLPGSSPLPSRVEAQSESTTSTEGEDEGGGNCTNSILGLPTWFRYLELNNECEVVGPTETVRGKDGELEQRFDWQSAAGYVAIAVLEILLRIGALVAVGFVMYGGFRFITSQGDPEGAKNARNTIINAIIGLVITIASASIVAFIANRLTS